MAISTFKTFLMKKGTGQTATYSKLVDIKDSPDLFGDPEVLDTTTCSDPQETGIPGIRTNSSLEFTANYSKTDFDTLKALEGQDLELAVWFGGTESGGTVTPTGVDGKFKFTGQISVSISGGGVNEVRDMKLTVIVSQGVAVDSTT